MPRRLGLGIAGKANAATEVDSVAGIPVEGCEREAAAGGTAEQLATHLAGRFLL